LTSCVGLLGRRRPWALWSMDLYPDAFAAAGLATPRNPLYRLLHRRVYRRRPDLLIALGPLQARFLQQQYGPPPIPTAITPCGVYRHQADPETPPWRARQRSKILLGYCGNLGEAHSVEFLRAVVQSMDRERFHLILSVYGSKANQLLQAIDPDDPGITRLDSVPREQFHHIDVHLVSLLTPWVHVCVPSKAISAVCSGSALLFYGSADCDNWELLRDAGWRVPESTRGAQVEADVAAALADIQARTLAEKKRMAQTVTARLQEMTEQARAGIAAWLHTGRELSQRGATRSNLALTE
jgi:hypothetical protein